MHNVTISSSYGCTNTSWALNTGWASNTGGGSDVIVLIEAGDFYSRKYGSTKVVQPSCQAAVTYY